MTEWSDDTLQRLFKRYVRDKASASVCAREFGVTRNVIAGKVWRLGWQRERPAWPARTPSRATTVYAMPKTPKPAKHPAKPLRRPVEPLEPVPEGGVPLLQLTSLFACRWSVGEICGEHRFCGRPTERPFGYCEDIHAKLAYAPSKVRAA